MLEDESKKYAIAILGGGSFGTALADISAHNGHSVKLWARSPSVVESINKHHINYRYLPELTIHPSVQASTVIQEVLDEADLVLIAIPAQFFRGVVSQNRQWLKNKVLISTTKGIEPDTFMLMSQILQQEVNNAAIGVLSGPNLSREIVAKNLTATVIASQDNEVCNKVYQALHCYYFRVYANNDTYGIELAGALKNIYAIATGMGVALGMGENTKSMLITRALAEMSRFAVMKGANPLTFIGLAGVGDLVATCTSSLSRNYTVGFRLGKGYDLECIQKELGQMAEGINTLAQVYQEANKLSIYMPVMSGLYRIVFEGCSVGMVVREMMKNEHIKDVEFNFKMHT